MRSDTGKGVSSEIKVINYDLLYSTEAVEHPNKSLLCHRTSQRIILFLNFFPKHYLYLLLDNTAKNRHMRKLSTFTNKKIILISVFLSENDGSLIIIC